MCSSFFKKDPILRIDILDLYGPVKIISDDILPKSSVLDVGCNSGQLGKILSKKNCLVDGVDINVKALKVARRFYNKTYKRNLYFDKLGLGKNKIYDYVVCSDILEHLPTPDLLLKDLGKYLTPSSKLWISLPNIARFELRIAHLLGRFNYEPGIMSVDHLKFFTLETAKKLIEDSGYKVLGIYPTGLGKRLGFLPKLFAFQFVFECKKKIVL